MRLVVMLPSVPGGLLQSRAWRQTGNAGNVLLSARLDSVL
jgi:hypothetical protein